MTEDPLHKANTHDLLIAAGLDEKEASQAQALMTGLVESGVLSSETPGGGLLWHLRSALLGLANLRANMPFQPGDRVMLRDNQPELEAARWAQRGLKSMTATFGEVGTVVRNDYNCVWGTWSVVVKFDHEWWEHYQTGELQEVDKPHVWAFHSSVLRQVTL